jgi:hypothetical protein
MATTKERTAAKRIAAKAQETRHSMSSRAHARAQPEGHKRRKPGTTGGGEFFHIEVRPREEFETFRTQDVGQRRGIERVAGKRATGSWDTQKWLISKEHAHIDDGKLVPDSEDAREVLNELGSSPERISGDRFQAKPRPSVPERR